MDGHQAGIVPAFRDARALRARAPRARARAPAIGGLGLCAQPRALRRPGEGAGSVGAPRNSNVRARALPRGAVAPARPPAAPARAACAAGARHSPVRALSMRCGPAHLAGAHWARCASRSSCGLALIAVSARGRRDWGASAPAGVSELAGACQLASSVAATRPLSASALHLALSGGMYGAESARWLRRCVRPQQTGRHLLGVWVLHEAVCSDAGALAAGILAQPCELVGLLLRRAG